MPSGRFDNILRGAPSVPMYDTVLWDLGEIVVSPTLGSIVPWVLAIPRDAAVNMAMWSQDATEPIRRIAEISRLAGRPADEVLWFEHGAAANGAITGCGVDHAHVHLLLRPPFSFEEFKAASRAAASLNWQEGTGSPYTRVSTQGSYLVAGKGNQYLVAQNVESAGSQFFRRVVASLIGSPNTWDYKSSPLRKCGAHARPCSQSCIRSAAGG